MLTDCEISQNWGLLFSLNGEALEESTHISMNFTLELVQSQNPYLSSSSPKYTLPWELPVSPLTGTEVFVSNVDVKEIPLTGVIFTITERGQWTRTGSHLSCVSAVDEMLDLGKKKEIFLWKIICK